jgi:amidase
MVAVAHGNDMGGSIRFPASMCGAVGLKPSRARSTLGPDFGEYWAMTTHEGVLTRSVRDTAAVLDAISGPGVGDPYTAPAPVRPFADEVGAHPGQLRVGFRTERTGGKAEAHPDGVEAVHLVAKLLEELGHSVEPVALDALDDDRFGEGIGVLFPTFIGTELERWGEKLGRTIEPSELEPWNAMQAEVARSITATQYVKAVEDLQSYARRVSQWWADGHDVLVTPMVADETPRLGELGPHTPLDEALERLVRITSFSMPFNVTGQPAISLPLHWGADGMPVGVQLVAAYGREDVLLRVASQLETARPWSDRRPPTAA